MAETVELLTVENGHYALVLEMAVLYDGIVDNLAVGIDILEPVPGDALEKGRHGEDGAGREPAAHVVAADVVEHRVVGYLEDIVLQLLQAMYAQDGLVGRGVAEDEVAKAHVALHEPA